MTINLNKQYVSKELLLKYLNEYDIYNHYLEEEILVGKNTRSPFYLDKTPSLGFFIGENNEVCFNDFKLQIKGDCVKFVQLKFNLTYFEALSKIAIDFGMEDDFIIKRKGIVKSEETPTISLIEKHHNKHKIGKIRKKWSLKELSFWKDYGISLETLVKYKVEPISHIVYGDTIITCKEIAFCFLEHKDGKETYKIYQPYSKDYKWLNNHDDSIWQGWEQLPEKGETLIITKSLKDVMAIHEVTGHYAVALQSENVLPKLNVVFELKERFENIIILYDNDYDKEENWGRIFAKRLSEHTGFDKREIPSYYECKDFSDFVKKYGNEKAEDLLLNEILLPF